MYLKVGEKLTLETLLYGLLLCSGNDAAVAIAEHVGKNLEDFVARMNDLAAELEMENSSFANPNGLDDEQHYSTARDMARLACAAVKNETLLRIASTRSVTIGGRTMTNHNRLLKSLDGCIGLKTGYTKAAGRTLVSCTERNGQRLVAVTLQDGNDWADHESLFEYGFSTYPSSCGTVLGKVVTWADVRGGVTKRVPVVAAESFSWPLAKEETLRMDIQWDEELTAPVSAGKTIGRAVFHCNGKCVGSVALLCGRTVLPRLDSAMAMLKTALPTTYKD